MRLEALGKNFSSPTMSGECSTVFKTMKVDEGRLKIPLVGTCRLVLAANNLNNERRCSTMSDPNVRSDLLSVFPPRHNLYNSANDSKYLNPIYNARLKISFISLT